jgi:hypothetical protein
MKLWLHATLRRTVKPLPETARQTVHRRGTSTRFVSHSPRSVRFGIRRQFVPDHQIREGSQRIPDLSAIFRRRVLRITTISILELDPPDVGQALNRSIARITRHVSSMGCIENCLQDLSALSVRCPSGDASRSRRICRRLGWPGAANNLPGVDGLAFQAGVVEGRADRQKLNALK